MNGEDITTYFTLQSKVCKLKNAFLNPKSVKNQTLYVTFSSIIVFLSVLIGKTLNLSEKILVLEHSTAKNPKFYLVLWKYGKKY